MPGTKLRWQPADRIEDIRGGGYPHVAGKRQDTVTIAGSLDYQAFDDRICYNPVLDTVAAAVREAVATLEIELSENDSVSHEGAATALSS